MSSLATAGSPATPSLPAGRSAPAEAFRSRLPQNAAQARAVAPPPSFPVWVMPTRPQWERNQWKALGYHWQEANAYRNVRPGVSGFVDMAGFRTLISMTARQMSGSTSYKYLTSRSRAMLSGRLAMVRRNLGILVAQQNTSTGQHRPWYNVVQLLNVDTNVVRRIVAISNSIASLLFAASNAKFQVRRTT